MQTTRVDGEIEGRVVRQIRDRMEYGRGLAIKCKEYIQDLNEIEKEYTKALVRLSGKSGKIVNRGQPSTSKLIENAISDIGDYCLKTSMVRDSFNKFVSKNSLDQMSQWIKQITELLEKTEDGFTELRLNMEKSIQQLDHASKTYLSNLTVYLRNNFVLNGSSRHYSIFGGSPTIRDPFITQTELYRNFVVYVESRKKYRQKIVERIREWNLYEKSLGIEILKLLQETFVIKSKHDIPQREFIQELCERLVPPFQEISDDISVSQNSIDILPNRQHLYSSETKFQNLGLNNINISEDLISRLDSRSMDKVDENVYIDEPESFMNELPIEEEFQKFCHQLLEGLQIDNKCLLVRLYSKLLDFKSGDSKPPVVGVIKSGVLFKQSSSLFRSWRPFFVFLTESKYLNFVSLSNKSHLEINMNINYKESQSSGQVDPTTQNVFCKMKSVTESLVVTHSLPLYTFNEIEVVSLSNGATFSIVYTDKKNLHNTHNIAKIVCGADPPSEKRYLLKANDEEDMTNWIIAIRDSIEETKVLNKYILRQIDQDGSIGESDDVASIESPNEVDGWNISEDLYEEMENHSKEFFNDEIESPIVNNTETAQTEYYKPETISPEPYTSRYEIIVDNPWEDSNIP
jgi:hypothetical protein